MSTCSSKLKKNHLLLGSAMLISFLAACLTNYFYNGYFIWTPDPILDNATWKKIDYATPITYNAYPEQATVKINTEDITKREPERIEEERVIKFFDKFNVAVPEDTTTIPSNLIPSLQKIGSVAKDCSYNTSSDDRKINNLPCWTANGFIAKLTSANGQDYLFVDTIYSIGYHVYYSEYLFPYDSATNALGSLKQFHSFHHDYDIHIAWSLWLFFYLVIFFLPTLLYLLITKKI